MNRYASVFLFTTLSLSLRSQGIYMNANEPGGAICPRVEREKTRLSYGAWSPNTTGGAMGANAALNTYYQQGSQFFPVGQRKSVAAFAAYDEHAKGTSLLSLRGKVVLVGLWSVRCEPSAKMLMELAALYPKRNQFGFDVLAVNFDENQQDGGGIEGGWRAINKFVNRNRQFFEVSKMPVHLPGLGKEGPSNFMDIVHSLPVLFVIDREGNLAQQHLGYKEGFVGEAIKRAIIERIPPVPVPEPVKPAQQ